MRVFLSTDHTDAAEITEKHGQTMSKTRIVTEEEV